MAICHSQEITGSSMDNYFTLHESAIRPGMLFGVFVGTVSDYAIARRRWEKPQ